jgi:hypothetical protein
MFITFPVTTYSESSVAAVDNHPNNRSNTITSSFLPAAKSSSSNPTAYPTAHRPLSVTASHSSCLVVELCKRPEWLVPCPCHHSYVTCHLSEQPTDDIPLTPYSHLKQISDGGTLRSSKRLNQAEVRSRRPRRRNPVLDSGS